MAYSDVEKQKEQRKKYYQENKDKIRKQRKEYRKLYNQRSYVKEENKKRQTLLREKRLEETGGTHFKCYNTEEKRVLLNKKNRDKYKNDPVYRNNKLMSRNILFSLKDNNISKKRKHWENLVSYTVKELMEHLESLFLPGMTWDNQGEWEIDHILPRSFFRFNSIDDVEFKMCWRLENLQPLWKIDNRKKKNKIINVV